jgi:hypothetical protein
VTPAEQAAAVYDREPCARTFREDLEAHLLNGYVFSTPSAFAMGRPVRSSADPAQIVNPWHSFNREECDAWQVYLAAGDISSVIHLEPFPLTFYFWERNNVLRIFLSKTVKRLCLRFSHSRPSFSGRLTGPKPTLLPD